MDEYDFESWEPYAELIERRDYEQLVAHCEKEADRRPGDLHALERLGNAYVLNGNYEKAVRRMGKCHREYPDIDAFQHIILDALFAMGKTEHDFDWATPPRVVRLGRAVCDLCYEYLRPKRKPRSVNELHSGMLHRGYLTFSEEQLLKALQADQRFVIKGDDPWGAEISVSRRRRRRTRR